MEQAQPNLAHALAAYVPGALVEWLRSGGALASGETTQFNAATLVAKFPGLTALVERLSQEGSAGAEAINDHVNAVLGELIAVVHNFGGVVASLDGDALIAYLPQSTDLFMTSLARRALTCALDMQGPAEAWDHGAQPRFGVKIGLAYGPLSAITVGDAETQQVFVIGGSSLSWAAECARRADGGQIVTAANIIAPLPDAITGDELEGRLHLVTGLEKRAEPTPAAPPDDDWPIWLENALKSFVAPKVAGLVVEEGKPHAESRRVVCMCVNFKGPDYDAPDAGQKLQAYIQPAMAIIRRYDGYLDRVRTNDAHADYEYSQLRVIFGAPGTYEDNERRAMACALALQRVAVVVGHEQCIGAASGDVFAGPLGAETRRHYAVVGKVTARAALLAAQAESGEVRVGAHIEARTNQEFAFQTVDETPTSYRLEGEHPAIGALAARYLLSDRPIVGRQEALAIIEAAIEQAFAGHGQIVTFVGPAGVGKCRLVKEVVARWLEAGGNGYSATALPQNANTPFGPWLDIWRTIFGLTGDSDPLTAHDRLVARLRGTFADNDQAAALLGPLLGIDIPTPDSLVTLDTRTRHQRLLEVCLDLIAGLAARTPLLLIFENLEQTDASTLELLAQLVPVIAQHRILLCLVSQANHATPTPAPEMDLYDLPHVTRIDLQPLTGAQSWTLVGQMVGEVDWPPRLRAQLEARLGSATSAAPRCHPLFVEETVNFLRQSGVLQDIGTGYHTVDADAAIGLPETLDDLLIARIERLEAPTRALMQTASTIGMMFTLPMLEAVYPDLMPINAMMDRLDALVEAGFILVSAGQEQPFHKARFRHLLIQAVARARLPAKRRRVLHHRVAEYLIVQREADAANVDDATLAYHYDAGDVHDKAAHYALRAAAHAQSLYANVEALHHYQTAERHVEQLAHNGESWPLHLQIYLNQGRIYLALGDYTRAEAAAQQAIHLAASHRNIRQQAQAFNLMAVLSYRQMRNEETIRFAEEAARLAEMGHFEPELVEAWRFMGRAYLRLGRREEALPPLWHATELARRRGDMAMTAKMAATMGVMYAGAYRMMDAMTALDEALRLVRPSGDKLRLAAYLEHLGAVHFRRGEGEKALAAYEEAADFLRALDERGRLGYVLRGMGSALCFIGRYQQALACIDEAKRLFEQNGDGLGVMQCLLARGRELERDLGRYKTAREHLQTARDALSQTDDVDAAVEATLALADVHICLDEMDKAYDTLKSARTWIESESAPWFWPEYHLVSGRLAMAQSDYTAALDHVYQALAMVSGRGDPRTLPRIYLLLARTLRAVRPNDEAPIRDALERCLRAGRGRARKLDRAIALKEIGHYLKEQTGQRTGQARGAGYLFEAEALFNEIGLKPPQQPGGF